MSRQANEAARYRHVCCHLRHAIIDQRDGDTVDRERNQETSRTGVVERAADGDEESGPDRPADGEKLDLPIAQTTLQVIELDDGGRVVPTLARRDGLEGETLFGRVHFLLVVIEHVCSADMVVTGWATKGCRGESAFDSQCTGTMVELDWIVGVDVETHGSGPPYLSTVPCPMLIVTRPQTPRSYVLDV